MPKFLDGYQTTFGIRSNLTKLSDTLNESLIRDNLFASSLDVKKIGSIYPVFVTALQDSEEKIPLFTHPYYFTTRDGRRVLATDVRLYMRKHVFDGSLTSLQGAVAHQIEFNFARSRAILNLEWLESDVENLKSSLWFATMLFGRWIADVLARAYALDPRDQQNVAIASTYYYQTLFTEETMIDEDTLHKWSIHTAKATHGDSKIIKEIFTTIRSKVPEVVALSSLIEMIKVSTGNVRLDSLGDFTLLTLLKNSWYGTNSKEIIAVATEHPPTWMAIVFASLCERTYRTSQIAKIAERIGKRGLGDEYLKQYRGIMERYSLSSSHTALARAGLV